MGIGDALGLNLHGFAADGDPDLPAGLNPFDVLRFEDNLDGLGELDVVDLVVVAAHAHDRQLAQGRNRERFFFGLIRGGGHVNRSGDGITAAPTESQIFDRLCVQRHLENPIVVGRFCETDARRSVCAVNALNLNNRPGLNAFDILGLQNNFNGLREFGVADDVVAAHALNRQRALGIDAEIFRGGCDGIKARGHGVSSAHAQAQVFGFFWAQQSKELALAIGVAFGLNCFAVGADGDFDVRTLFDLRKIVGFQNDLDVLRKLRIVDPLVIAADALNG